MGEHGSAQGPLPASAAPPTPTRGHGPSLAMTRGGKAEGLI